MKKEQELAYLGRRHPLGSVARDRCLSEHRLSTSRIGGVACGRCWEQAIRADERVVIELGLPPEPHADPDLVDEVAVDRACAGDSVRLTKAERRAAVTRLLASGLLPGQVSAQLGMSWSAISAFLPDDEVAA